MLKVCKKKKTTPWDIEDIKLAVSKLGTDKARNPEGLRNELFKEEVAGDDLFNCSN